MIIRLGIKKLEALVNEKATLVYTFRNRDVGRVRKSLLSLIDKNKDIEEAIIIDYGSASEYETMLREKLRDLPARIIRTETEGQFWNKSSALNLGIDSTNTKFAVTADIDILFDSPCVDHCIETYEPQSAIFQYYWFLPESGDINESVGGGQDNCGGFMFMPKDDIVKVGGWDEHYEFWGLEDKDWKNRLERYGFEIMWMDPETYRGYHVWHQQAKDKGMYEVEAMRLRKNYVYMKNSIHPCLPFKARRLSKEDRPILEYVNDPGIRIIDCSKMSIEY
jgi:GT2 family glycosyltransferase